MDIVVPSHRPAASAGKSFPRVITRLSLRETQVLACASDGRSNRQIADLLGMSENTVKAHFKNIHVKLGAQRRTEAVRIARDHGLLPAMPPIPMSLSIVANVPHVALRVAVQSWDSADTGC